LILLPAFWGRLTVPYKKSRLPNGELLSVVAQACLKGAFNNRDSLGGILYFRIKSQILEVHAYKFSQVLLP